MLQKHRLAELVFYAPRTGAARRSGRAGFGHNGRFGGLVSSESWALYDSVPMTGNYSYSGSI